MHKQYPNTSGTRLRLQVCVSTISSFFPFLPFILVCGGRMRVCGIFSGSVVRSNMQSVGVGVGVRPYACACALSLKTVVRTLASSNIVEYL